MGSKSSKQLEWDPKKRDYIQQYLETNQNPKIIRFNDFKFPI
jgi:hypothetical protein